MKKFLSLFCILFIGLSSQATQLYPYQVDKVQSINGTIERKGGSDLIILQPSEPFNWKDSMFKSTGVLTAAMLPFTAIVMDPYIIPIEGENYVMIQENNDGKWTKQDLLGINDSQNNIFLSLKQLESDGDYSKLTPNELKKAGIRLVKINKDKSLLVKNSNQDYDLNKIDYIDMTKLRKTANSEKTGIFGHFNVHLKQKNTSKTMVVGYVTFDTDQKLEVMFE